MESVSLELIPKAASQVLLGGIVSAILGTEAAVFGKSLLTQDYAGSFMLLGGLYLLAFLLLSQFNNTIIKIDKGDAAPGLLEIIAFQPVFWVAGTKVQF